MTILEPLVEIDLEGAGKMFGAVRFPLEESWRGSSEVVVPACVIANGSGPTVTLWGGNHGDEYEGPIVLGRLTRELDPAAIQGRLIILPTINPPALAAASRTSSIDGKNMNRVWPGNGSGTITDRIVEWLDREVLSRSSVLMDLHTGGDAMQLVPMSMCLHTDDPAQRGRIRAAQLAFNAPLGVEIRLGADRLTASGRAHDRGLLVVGSETGGGGPVTAETLHVCYRGVRNTLAFLEVLEAPSTPDQSRTATRLTRKWGHHAEVQAERAGIFVPHHALWDEIVEGQPAGQLHALERPFDAPETILFPSSGLIAGRLGKSYVRPGDVLYWVVQDLD